MHVRNQITLWDSFLNARIRLQNPINLANRFPRGDTFQVLSETEELAPQVQEAQRAVRGLLEALFALRTVSHDPSSICVVFSPFSHLFSCTPSTGSSSSALCYSRDHSLEAQAR